MFTSTVASFLSMVFSNIYSLFSINWPGTNVSIFSIFIGVTISAFMISLVKHFTGFTFGIAGSGGRGQRGGNSRNIHVNDDRKGDTR